MNSLRYLIFLPRNQKKFNNHYDSNNQTKFGSLRSRSASSQQLLTCNSSIVSINGIN